MGNIYVTCARCNKGMTIAEYNCVFCSDIDNQFVCADCYKKEQPKELMKQITDLEAKLDEKTRVAEGYSELFDKRQHENYEQFCEIQELKAKLAESEKAFDTISAKYEKKSEQIFEIIKRREECSDAYDLLSKENYQLKKKLAEKEKEIAKHKEETVTFTPKLLNNAELVIKIIQSDDDGIDYLKQSQNQIVIAELENVKELIKNNIVGMGIPSQKHFISPIIDGIDQQIKSLKGESENV